MSLALSLTLIGLVLVCAVIQRVAGMGLGIVFAPMTTRPSSIGRTNAYRS
ncbi:MULTISPECIES: hypothetical protein [Brachybacterium]|nr:MULTISPECIES: hypothetical protein [Brachybacterium]GAP80069.1 hypothetical protein Y09_2927 [Brachybacterium sp. SW0106-09]